MELDVNKIALNKRLEAFILEDYNHPSKKDYIYKGTSFTKDLNKFDSFKKDGTWSTYNPDAPKNLITQFNFLSSEPYHISDLFILVDRSESGRSYIYRDIQCSLIDPSSKGIFDNNEYILCDILENESKKIYNKFWELKTRLK